MYFEMIICVLRSAIIIIIHVVVSCICMFLVNAGTDLTQKIVISKR